MAYLRHCYYLYCSHSKLLLVLMDSLLARKQVAKCLPQDWDAAVHFAKNAEEALAALVKGK
jgi:hypothetical protein